MPWRRRSSVIASGAKASRSRTIFRLVSSPLSARAGVLALVAAGLMNKQIAAEIDLAEITVKIHRGRVMKKMGARSLADLVRMAEALGVRRTKP